MRNVTKALTVVSLLAPVSAYSLGIGDIRVRSALNQNLNAEISLVGAPGETPANIKVSLASPEKFDEAGVAWSYFLSKIKFQPVVKANGAMVIKVTSREALKEPYLNFLLEVSWPKGNLYREFTVLVDPPTDYQEPAYPAATTYDNYAPREQAYEPRPRSVRHSPARSRRSSGAGGGYGGQITARRNDTLWKLAERARGAGVSVEQMMMSLYEKNPQAFFQQNVNALSAGKTLKIPEKSVVQQTSREQALAEFSKHNEAWKNGLAVPSTETQVVKEEPVDNQLKLVAPTDAAVTQNEAVTPSTEESAGTTANPTPATATGQQAVDKAAAAKLDNAVQSKMAALEKQLAMMQQLIVLKDKQLANLQHPEETAPANQLPTQAQPQEPVKSEPLPPVAVTQQPVPTAPLTAVQPVAPVRPVVSPVVKNSVQPEPVVPAEADSSFLWIVGGIGATLLSLFGWLWWRKQKIIEETDADSMFANYSALRNSGMLDSAIASRNKPGVESSFLNDFKASDFESFESFNVDHSDIDPIAEADVYLTYGRYQQAEDLIREAIRDNPDRDVCKLKLLEIFHASANKEDFEKYANELVVAGKKADTGFWAKVVALGHDISPDSELFSASDASNEAVFTTESGALVENVMISPSEPDQAAKSIAGVEQQHLGAATFAVSDEEGEESLFEASYQEPPSQHQNESLADVSAFEVNEPDLDVDSFDDDLDDLQNNQAMDFDLGSYSGNVKNANAGSGSLLAESAAGDESSKLKSDKTIDEKNETEVYEFDFDFDKPDISASNKAKTQEVSDSWNPDKTLDFSLDNDIKLGSFEGDTLDFDFDLGFPKEKGDVAQTKQSQEFTVSDLTDMDQMETKLDLAKAYIDMGDTNSAIEIIGQVLEKGTAEQKQTAQSLLEDLNS